MLIIPSIQEELFDQILSGLFEFNSPDWDPVSYPAKVCKHEIYDLVYFKKKDASLFSISCFTFQSIEKHENLFVTNWHNAWLNSREILELVMFFCIFGTFQFESINVQD